MFGRDSITNLFSNVKLYSHQIYGKFENVHPNDIGFQQSYSCNLVQGLPEPSEYAIICPQFILSGRSAVRLARLHGVQEVGGSNPLAPTMF
jgi:hypothetical protein